MSSSDSKRSKRRRNKRGGGNNRPVTASSNANVGNTQLPAPAKADGQVISTIPVPSTLTELDIDSIPQPMSQMPRSHNPYLDREHCLLCRRERPDPPANRIPPGVGSEKENNRHLPITTQMPLWLCPDCRRTVEEEEANSTKNFDPSAIGELLLPSTLPLITGLQNLEGAFSSSSGMAGDSTSVVTSMSGGKGGGSGGGGGGAGDGPCQCEPCRERREIAAEQEHSRQQLGECWTELSHLVRCIYWEAGTSLTGEESTTKLSLPRMKELVHRLCAHDPHMLYMRLEAEVEDFIKEMRERLLKQLEAGFRTPPLAKQFITMLLEEYAALCSAAQTLLAILEELEKEHLHKFNLTWPLHNKHLFHALIYMEPGLHDNLGTLIKQLRAVASQKEPYHEESYSNLLQRYLQFDNDMSVVAVVWRDCQQLIEDYTDEQELYKGKEAMNRSWDASITTTRPRPLSCEANKATNNRNLYQCHSALLNHMANGSGGQDVTTNHRGSTKKKCLCDDCSLNRLTSSLLTPDLYEEIGLKHLSDAAPGGQLSALDTYLQSINPPDLSSTTSSSECSSQGDSEEVIPIFSRTLHSGFCSPRSDDSDDSDDLDSESSPSPSHENAFEDEEDDGEGRQNESSSRGQARCRASFSGVGSDRQSNGSDIKKDANNSNGQPCECHVCAANNGSHLPAAAMMTANVGDTKPSYLFYPNLQSHQPLDLSHPGISAKHPLIHPHLYNLTSQKPNKIPSHTQQAFQLNLDASDGLQNYGDWNSAYESAKMVLHTHSHAHYGHEEAPDLIQSAKAAIQSNCRAEKAASENRSAKIQPVHHNSEVKVAKEEKGKKHSHDGTTGLISNGISEWTKQQRLAKHLHNDKGKNSSTVAQELCSKHNLPTVPKLPNNNLFFSPPRLQGSDATSAGGSPITQESLAQQFGSGVLTQQALMTQGMLAAQGAGLQLQNAGIHMADVHHLQHQHQQQQQHAPSDGKKKKKSLGGDDTLPAEPTVLKLPDYLNEQHLHACSHQSQLSHPSSVLGTNAGLCNSSMQTAASTPTSASVCSSEPDYETPNYQNDEDTPSNYDDKDSNASSTTRERESKHCECCYCEFFGQGPQPAPTSRNYTEIRDRLRLRLRERKQPKDHSPSHEPSPPNQHPPNETVLHADDRKVEDLLSFIEGAKKTKSSSKAAKRQRQRQKRAEQKSSKSEPDSNHKNDIHVPVSLHHHHHHHHHHHVEVSTNKQCEQLSTHNTTTSCKLQQPPPATSKHHQASVKQSLEIHKPESVPTSKGQPRPNGDPKTSSAASRTTSLPTSTSSVTSSAVSKQDSSHPRPVPMVTSQDSAPKDGASTGKKGRGSNATQPPVQPSAPSSNDGSKSLESKSKGKQNGAGKQGPSLAQVVHADNRGKTDQEMGNSKRDQVTSSKAGAQSSQQRLSQKQQQQPQQQKNDKTSRHDSAWKTSTSSGQERLLNGNASDSSSSSSLSVGSKSSNLRTKQGGAASTNIDDPHLKKQSASPKPTQGAAQVNNRKSAAAPTTTTTSTKTNHTSRSVKEQLPQKMEETATARLASKRSETNHKMETRTAQNGSGHEQTNGMVLTNGNSTTNKRRKKKKNSDNPNASIDEIFLPKENVDMNEMDETERELEAFKRFCMASTPQQHKEKVVFNVKDLALKKSSLQAH